MDGMLSLTNAIFLLLIYLNTRRCPRARCTEPPAEQAREAYCFSFSYLYSYPLKIYAAGSV